MGNSVARSSVSLTSSVFSISSQQKLAPRWANPHLKALCIYRRQSALHTYGSSLLTHAQVNSIIRWLARSLSVCFCDREIWFFHTYSPHHPHHTDPAPNVNLVSLYALVKIFVELRRKSWEKGKYACSSSSNVAKRSLAWFPGNMHADKNLAWIYGYW